jgi:SAM-dependent methyltransferase
MVRDEVFEQAGGPGAFNFITLVEWENVAALESATAAAKVKYQESGFNPQEFIPRLGIEADLANYTRIEPANTMSDTIDQTTFEGIYARNDAPWETGKPHPQLVAVADRVTSPVLDAGCGTGEVALFLAARGHEVTGIDFVEEAIRRARSKAAARGLKVEFLHKDALTLREWSRQFATVIDFGLFHVFSDADRRRYVEGLRTVLAPGGRLFLACFSDEEPGTEGPRRVSRQELHEAFADGFEIESIEPTQFKVNPQVSVTSFSPGGPKAWLAIIRRKRERNQ